MKNFENFSDTQRMDNEVITGLHHITNILIFYLKDKNEREPVK